MMARVRPSMESRQYLSNPTVIGFVADKAYAYPGQTLTLIARVSSDAGVGVRAVSFWIEDDRDNQHRFVRDSFDQPLGDVVSPNPGFPDFYSIQVTVQPSCGAVVWPSVSTRFGVDVTDNAGHHSQTPILFVTVDTSYKPVTKQ